MKLLHRANWSLAVLAEMAMPGHMKFAPILGDAGEVIDFIWLEASPTSTLAFGCAGENLVGRMLKQVLVEGSIDASVFASYQTVYFQKRAQVVRVVGKNGIHVHCISPSPSGLSIKVTCDATMDQVLAAQILVRGLQ